MDALTAKEKRLLAIAKTRDAIAELVKDWPNKDDRTVEMLIDAYFNMQKARRAYYWEYDI